MESARSEVARLERLGVAVKLLWLAAPDLDDPAEEAAYYGHVRSLVSAVIATPARTFPGAQVKAELVAWCCASRTGFGLGETCAERVLESLLRDLLADQDPGGG